MDNVRNKALCLALIRADNEERVISLLEEAGYWRDPKVWRYYGDRETNFNTIGNQQGATGFLFWNARNDYSKPFAAMPNLHAALAAPTPVAGKPAPEAKAPGASH